MTGRVALPAVKEHEATPGAKLLHRGRLALRRQAPSLLAAALVFALWLVSFWAATRLGQLWPGFSLRYDTPVSGQAAAAARRYAVDNPDDSPWPTFWRQDDAALQSELFSLDAPCLYYSGQGSLVWPAQFTRGGWPGATDEAGCAVSQGLALALWGSTDVLGKTVEADGKALTVRGIFEGDDPLLLASVGDSFPQSGWQGVELDAETPLARTEAEDFAAKSGLGAPSAILSGGIEAIALLACFLPPLAGAALWGARRLARWGRASPVWAQVLAFGMALGFALLLPGLLGLLSAWLIPGQWSDFSFWGSLAATLSARFDELLSLTPALRDVAAKKALILAACAGLAGLFPALWLGWRRAVPQPSPPPHT